MHVDEPRTILVQDEEGSAPSWSAQQMVALWCPWYTLISSPVDMDQSLAVVSEEAAWIIDKLFNLLSVSLFFKEKLERRKLRIWMLIYRTSLTTALVYELDRKRIGCCHIPIYKMTFYRLRFRTPSENPQLSSVHRYLQAASEDMGSFKIVSCWELLPVIR